VSTWDDDLSLAHAAADAADAVTMARFLASDLQVESKPDLTPVTDADRASETTIRAILERERPHDDVLGEEYGATGDGTGRRWVLDPIDGTKNYVRGVPVWGTLIGLQQDGQTVAGVVSAPALGRRWWAAQGSGAWTGPSVHSARACLVSKVASLSDAYLGYSSLPGWDDIDRLPQFLGLLRAVWRSRGFGDFLTHMLVAEGAVDASAEPEVSLWDLAALQVVVTEAGGRFTDLSGVDGADGGSVLASNGLLHDELLGILGVTGAVGSVGPAGPATA
jgi:histidinol-phosphatase